MINHVQFPGLGLEFTLNRVAFTIGGLDVYWYGIILATGLLAGMAFAFRYAVDFGIDADRLGDVVVIGTVCGVACARRPLGNSLCCPVRPRLLCGLCAL